MQKNVYGPFEVDEVKLSIILEPNELLYVKFELPKSFLKKHPDANGYQILFDRLNSRIVYFVTGKETIGFKPKVYAKLGIDYYAVGEYATGLPIHPIYGSIGAVLERKRLKPANNNDSRLVYEATEVLSQEVLTVNQAVEVFLPAFNPFAKTIYEDLQNLINEDKTSGIKRI